MSVFIEEYVLRLEIAVDDFLRVEVLESKKNFRSEELRDVLLEFPVVLQVLEEFSAFNEVHDEEEFIVGLEGVLEFH